MGQPDLALRSWRMEAGLKRWTTGCGLCRFTRLLRQDLSSVAKYLLPSSEPALCAPGQGNCCQADSYASPYQLKYLNSSQVLIGARTYTTFFYNFNSAAACRTDLDAIGCCSASANTIWVDVGECALGHACCHGRRPGGGGRTPAFIACECTKAAKPAAAAAPLAVMTPCARWEGVGVGATARPDTDSHASPCVRRPRAEGPVCGIRRQGRCQLGAEQLRPEDCWA